MYRVWSCRESMSGALRSGRLQFEGDRRLVRNLPKVFELSPLPVPAVS